MLTALVLLLSILVQFLAAALAIGTARLTGWRAAWTAISVALTLMAVHRAIGFYGMAETNAFPQTVSVAELLPLGISLLMLWGVILMAPYFRGMEEASGELRLNRQRLNDAQNIAGIGNWEWTIATGDLWWSDEIYRVFGHAPQAIVPTYGAFLAAIHPEDRDEVARAVEQSLADKTRYDIEHRIVLPNGDIRYVHERGHATYNAQGDPLHMRGTVHDITRRKLAEIELQRTYDNMTVLVEGRTHELSHELTERKFAEEALRESEGRLRSVLDNVVDGIITIGEDGFIQSANPATEKIFNYKIEEMIGRNISMLMPEPDRSQHKVYLGNFRRTGQSRIIGTGRRVRGQRKDGSTFPLHLAIGEALLGKRKIFTGIVRDITEMIEAEQKLQQAKEAAETANKAKSEFLSSMSHELRTPLNAILGFGQLLEINPETPLSETQAEYISHILQGGEHLLDLINEILDLARIEAGGIDLSIEDVDPAPVIDACIMLTTSMANKNDVHVAAPDCAMAPPRVRADLTRFKQVLLNFISNAVKYNRRGGDVAITCEIMEGEKLRIRIADTGPGIPQDKQHDLFLPFKRLGAELKNIEGSGIGLTITKKLIEEMNGGLGFESEEGIGSTFWFELPLSTGPKPSLSYFPDDAEPGAPTTSDTPIEPVNPALEEIA